MRDYQIGDTVNSRFLENVHGNLLQGEILDYGYVKELNAELYKVFFEDDVVRWLSASALIPHRKIEQKRKESTLNNLGLEPFDVFRIEGCKKYFKVSKDLEVLYFHDCAWRKSEYDLVWLSSQTIIKTAAKDYL